MSQWEVLHQGYGDLGARTKVPSSGEQFRPDLLGGMRFGTRGRAAEVMDGVTRDGTTRMPSVFPTQTMGTASSRAAARTFDDTDRTTHHSQRNLPFFDRSSSEPKRSHSRPDLAYPKIPRRDWQAMAPEGAQPLRGLKNENTGLYGPSAYGRDMWMKDAKKRPEPVWSTDRGVAKKGWLRETASSFGSAIAKPFKWAWKKLFG